MYRLSYHLRILAFITLAMAALAGCGDAATDTVAVSESTELPATPTEQRPASLLLTPPPEPEPVEFPRDEGPHDVLSEWWYYTGHLTTEDGHRYGFEFVIFQGIRANLPPSYAAHFAITDIDGDQFQYAERTQTAGQTAGQQPIDLSVDGWTLEGGGGEDRISAEMEGYALDLTVDAAKSPVLHDGDGWFEFAPATGSYYYSYTRMEATGTLTVAGQPMEVTGQAWMDHQWGNFLLFGGGGWDWFSIQLEDDREIMFWQSHDGEGTVSYGSGTIIEADGTVRELALSDFTLRATGDWTSPHTGGTYPSGWEVDIPSEQISLMITPTMADQELQTVQSTGVVYWEGAVEITGNQDGETIAGNGYVELTGYAPAAQEAP